jgi:hypothetical protein
MNTVFRGFRRYVGPPLIALVLAPAAQADPPSIEPGMESAALTVDALQAKGYDVVIQYAHGQSGLSSCSVTDIDKGVAGSERIAYVTVDCPD